MYKYFSRWLKRQPLVAIPAFIRPHRAFFCHWCWWTCEGTNDGRCWHCDSLHVEKIVSKYGPPERVTMVTVLSSKKPQKVRPSGAQGNEVTYLTEFRKP